MQAEHQLQRIIGIIKRLRAPDGCPWDRVQTNSDIAKYLLEEAHEVIDAIHAGSPDALREELGDLLFHILFLACMAEEERKFSVADVMAEIAEKMTRRHPHVFGKMAVSNVREVKDNWEEIKKAEYRKKGIEPGLLDGIPRSLPALMKAQVMGKKAARIGFDWAKTEDVILKVEEEWSELNSALKLSDKDYIREEIGDMLFSIVNLCRFTGVDAEDALQSTNRKFAKRFAYIEKKLQEQGSNTVEATLEEMDKLWDESKKEQNSHE
jgi:tetrapyrrole methylase family protein / MazG family protein